jgi:hypothetical protein
MSAPFADRSLTSEGRGRRDFGSSKTPIRRKKDRIGLLHERKIKTAVGRRRSVVDAVQKDSVLAFPQKRKSGKNTNIKEKQNETNW